MENRHEELTSTAEMATTEQNAAPVVNDVISPEQHTTRNEVVMTWTWRCLIWVCIHGVRKRMTLQDEGKMLTAWTFVSVPRATDWPWEGKWSHSRSKISACNTTTTAQQTPTSTVRTGLLHHFNDLPQPLAIDVTVANQGLVFVIGPAVAFSEST